MGLKETRQAYFEKWAAALVEKDWELCDIMATLIIDTLPDNSPQKTKINQNLNEIEVLYQQQAQLLHEILSSMRSPIRREEFKEKAILKLESWKVRKIRHMFLQVFMKDSLIQTEK